MPPHATTCCYRWAGLARDAREGVVLAGNGRMRPMPFVRSGPTAPDVRLIVRGVRAGDAIQSRSVIVNNEPGHEAVAALIDAAAVAAGHTASYDGFCAGCLAEGRLAFHPCLPAQWAATILLPLHDEPVTDR